MASRFSTELDRFDDDALSMNDRDTADDAERADADVYTLSVDVSVYDGSDLQTVCDEITSNIESVGWTVETIEPRTSALTVAQAEILVRSMFRYVVGEFPTMDNVSKVAAIICDAADLDRESFGPLHTAYARVKAEYRRTKGGF